MQTKSMKQALAHLATGLFSLLLLPVSSRADVVYPGWDLFTTVPGGTVFGGVNWQGVGLGNYNFPGVGTFNVGNVDTIMRRDNPPGSAGQITVPGNFPLYLEALQLKSVVPIFGPNYGYITLQSARGGPDSVGTMQVNPFTFSSFFDVFFDVRDGGLNGPIMQSGMLPLSGGGGWHHDPTGGPIIPGVNFLLNGATTAADFWPIGTIEHLHQNYAATHTVENPEPGQVALMALTLFGVGGFVLRRRLARK